MTIPFNKRLSLGKNFTLGEMLVSSSYPDDMGRVILSEPIILKQYYGVQFGLQPIRDMFGPVIITRGYQPSHINKLVGGVENSQHVQGEAWDFVAPDADMAHVFDFIVNELTWPGQVIMYEGKHIHLALPRPGIRANQFVKSIEKTSI